MVFDEDIIDKKVIIVDGKDKDNISIEIEPIKNVTSIKLVESYATIVTNSSLQKIYICLNDYRLKTVNNGNTSNDVFSSMIFHPNTAYNEPNGTGTISTFNLDTQNYVFNPIKGELRKLDISFKHLDDDDNLTPKILTNFYLEFCIYSKRMKQTMF